MINLVSVRVGPKYPREYTAILHDMLARNMSTMDHRHYELTDDPEGLPDYVNAIPHDPAYPGWWAKVQLFSPDMPWEPGERVIYFDLDTVICGRLEDLEPGIIQDALWPCYNSSVMVWNVGEHAEIWEDFDPSCMALPGRVVPPECLPKGQINGGDQEWITECSSWNTFPEGMFVPYKLHKDWPPGGCKAVLFNGSPKNHEITEGWVPDVWRVGGFTSLPEMKGVNVSYETIWENVESSVQRDLPWFSGYDVTPKTMVLVCGGPSLAYSLKAIREHKQRGAIIVTVNNTMRYLLEHGITPNCHVMLDARPDNASFVQNAPDIKYFIASQCHPSVFDALANREVIVWHNGIGEGERLDEIAAPWAKPGVRTNQPDGRPIVQVPGGCTVGLRALWLGFASGYRKIHVYGMDSSHSDAEHHAYAQPLNDGEMTLNVQMAGRSYVCSKWMARQAEDFRGTWHDLRKHGVSLRVHGSGLIPDMAQALMMEAMAA